MSKFTVPYFQTPNDIFKLDLKSNEKLVYIYLCRCGNEGKNAFPSYQTIATNCSISKSSAIRSMNKLVEIGLVIKQYRFKEGENYSNIYKVNYNLGSVTQTLGSVTVITGSVTDTPNKELVIKNQLERNNYLQFSEKTERLFKFLGDYSENHFGKSIRKHNNLIDLDELYDIVIDYEDEFYEFIDRRIKTYDNCSLDYLNSIKGDFAAELYEH